MSQVNSLFHSRSTHRNVGRPIKLHCVSDIIHGNNGDQESWAIETVCRILGYAVPKSKGCQEFRELLEYVWELDNRHWKVWMSVRLFPSLSVAKGGFLSRIFFPWWLEPPRRTTNCLRTVLSYATVVPHFIGCHILHSYKHCITIFAIAGNKKQSRLFTRPIFPCVAMMEKAQFLSWDTQIANSSTGIYHRSMDK